MAGTPQSTNPQTAAAVSAAFDPRLRDFRNFVYLLWLHLGLPAPTPVQYDIAGYLQHGPRRRMIQAFRGVGKSWLTAAFVLWRLLLNPDERVLVVSASKDRADAFSVFVKRLIEEWQPVQHLRPDPSKGHRDSVVAFDVGPSSPAQAPSVRSVGITGQMTGGRATIIVADDVETPKNSMTVLMRERLGELVKEFDAVLVPDGEIVYLGTPQTEESVYSKLPERGYDIRIWPALVPDAAWRATYGDKLAPYVAVLQAPEGSSTDPQRFSDADLGERALSYGRSGFALQFMLDTRASDADRHPLRLRDLILWEGAVRDTAPVRLTWGTPPSARAEIPNVGFKLDGWFRPIFSSEDEAPITGAVMFIDPAGRGKDETSYAVVKLSAGGLLYLTRSGGFRDGYTDDVLLGLATIAKQEAVKLVLVEPNFGDGMFSKLLEPHMNRTYPCVIEEAPRATTQKERRIVDTLEPVLNQHRLVVLESVVQADLREDDPHRQLFYQLTRITADRGSLKFDDRLDALAGAVRYWVDRLALGAKEAEERHRKGLLKEELDRFMKHALGKPRKQKALKLDYTC